MLEKKCRKFYYLKSQGKIWIAEFSWEQKSEHLSTCIKIKLNKNPKGFLSAFQWCSCRLDISSSELIICFSKYFIARKVWGFWQTSDLIWRSQRGELCYGEVCRQKGKMILSSFPNWPEGHGSQVTSCRAWPTSWLWCVSPATCWVLLLSGSSTVSRADGDTDTAASEQLEPAPTRRAAAVPMWATARFTAKGARPAPALCYCWFCSCYTTKQDPQRKFCGELNNVVFVAVYWK